jgi:hypothetical protein
VHAVSYIGVMLRQRTIARAASDAYSFITILLSAHISISLFIGDGSVFIDMIEPWHSSIVSKDLSNER